MTVVITISEYPDHGQTEVIIKSEYPDRGHDRSNNKIRIRLLKKWEELCVNRVVRYY